MGIGGCIAVVGDVKIVTCIKGVDGIDGGLLRTGGTGLAGKDGGGHVEVGLDGAVNLCYRGPGGLLVLVVDKHEGDAGIAGCAGGVGLSEVTGKLEVCGGTEEVGLALDKLGSVFNVLSYLVLSGIGNRDVEVLDGRVVAAPEVFDVIVGRSEVVVGLMDGSIVVSEVDGGVESIEHEVFDDHVVTVLEGAV